MVNTVESNEPRADKNKLLVIDGLIAMVLFAVSALLSALTFGYLDPVLYGLLGVDFWFHSDMTRVFYNLKGVEASHYRASVHPLFSLIAYYAAILIKALLNLFSQAGDEQLAQFFIAMVAGTWIAALYSLLRVLRLARTDAILFSLLGALSAASLFWFSVPETYSLGSVSILSALIVAAVHLHRPLSEGWFVAASAFSLSVTITNWMAGLAAAFFNLNLGKAIRVTLLAFLIVYLLWLLEKQLLFAAGSVLDHRDELMYIFRKETGGPFHILVTFFSTSMVMPEIKLIAKLDRPDWLILSVQHSLPWRSGLLCLTAFSSWMVLFCLGFWRLLVGPLALRFRLLIGALLLGQAVLHLIYGEETFLYSLHYLPLLVITSALAVTGPYRRVVLVLATVVLISAGTNNFLRFREARGIMMQHFYPDRESGIELNYLPLEAKQLSELISLNQ